MKNKRSMLIISAMVLLLAVVLGMGGTTFAKYVTTKSMQAPQSATVAQWGWTVSVSNDALFGTGYDETGVINNSNGYAIMSSSASTLIGPGSKSTITVTDGSLTDATAGVLKFSISGEAEVASQVVVNFTTAQDIFYDKDGNANTYEPYYPIVWTLWRNNEKVAGVDTLAKVKDYFTSEQVAAGEEYTKAGDYVLSYEWKFQGQSDEYDTILGEFASGKALPDGATAQKTVIVNLTISVEQIQDDVAP